MTTTEVPHVGANATPSDQILRLTGISKHFAGVKALDDVSLEVTPGEVHALLGQNGAGKSTLIKILAGAYRADAGEISVGSEPLTISSPADATRAGLAFIHQDLSLVPYFDGYENIAMGDVAPTHLGIAMDWRTLRSRAREAARLVDIDFDLATPVSRLSVPQRQLVAMARALLRDARVIVMDEPTASLGAHEVEQVFKVVRRLRDQGRAVIYVTHRLDEVDELATRVSVLRDGRYIGTYDRESIASRDELVRLITGKSPHQLVRADASTRGALLLSARGLRLAPKVQEVDLDLHAGEITGIAGLVGSGRSEIAHMLAGLEKPQAGTVRRHDENRKAPIALLPEDRQGESAVPTMSIRENLTLASLSRWSRGVLTNRRRERRVVAEYVEKLQIKLGSPEAPITDLSGGNQQKVLLAKWLATGAQVYVLDEPTQGVDVGAQEEIHVHIKELARSGCAVAFISSDLSELCRVSDRVVVVHQGRVVADLPGTEATEDRVSALCFGLDDPTLSASPSDHDTKGMLP